MNLKALGAAMLVLAGAGTADAATTLHYYVAVGTEFGEGSPFSLVRVGFTLSYDDITQQRALESVNFGFDDLEFTLDNTGLETGPDGLTVGGIGDGRGSPSEVANGGVDDFSVTLNSDLTGRSLIFSLADTDRSFTAGKLSVVDRGPPPSLPAVPEPSTWGMMALGFGLVGATARRRYRLTSEACAG